MFVYGVIFRRIAGVKSMWMHVSVWKYIHMCASILFIKASCVPVVNAYPVRKDSRSQESPPALFSHHNLILPQSFLELSALENSNADLAWADFGRFPPSLCPSLLHSVIELDLQPLTSDAIKLPCIETMLIIMLFTYIFSSLYFLETGLYSVAQTTLKLMTIFGPLILLSASIIDMYHHV